MKSKREFQTAQAAGLHSARSQKKHEYDIYKQKDYNHGKNDYSLHIQGHGNTCDRKDTLLTSSR